MWFLKRQHVQQDGRHPICLDNPSLHLLRPDRELGTASKILIAIIRRLVSKVLWHGNRYRCGALLMYSQHLNDQTLDLHCKLINSVKKHTKQSWQVNNGARFQKPVLSSPSCFRTMCFFLVYLQFNNTRRVFGVLFLLVVWRFVLS